MRRQYPQLKSVTFFYLINIFTVCVIKLCSLAQAIGKIDDIVVKVAWIVQVDKLDTIVDCSCVNFDHIVFWNF